MKEKSEIKNEVKITVEKLLNALSNKNLLLKNQYPDVYDKLILDRHKITIQMMIHYSN